MTRTVCVAALLVSALLGAGCSRQPSAPASAPAAAEDTSAYRIYVTNETTGEMSIIGSSRHDVIATVPLGKRPRGIHASPDGKTIYVALSGSPIAGPGVDESKLPPADKSADGIGVFDVAQNKIVRVIKSGSDPEEFAVSHDGKLIYVSNEDTGEVSILDVDQGAVVKSLKTGEEPEGVEITPDGKFVYVTSEDDGSISVVDTAAGTIRKTFKVGRRPRSIAFMPDSSRGYVTAENDGTVLLVDAVKHATTGKITLGEAGVVKPMSVLLSQSADTLFVSTGRGRKVFMIDTKSNEIQGSVDAGQRPWGIALSPDGKTLYTANGPSNDVSVIDVATKAVTKKIKTSGSPWGVITLPR